MGIFSNVSSFIQTKAKERTVRKEEEQEIVKAESQALKEARIKAAPEFAKRRVAVEQKLKLASLRVGKGSGLQIGNIQNMAHGIGQSTTNQFNRDFDSMFGGGSGKKESKATPSAFQSDYDRMFGSPAKPKSKPKVHHKKQKMEWVQVRRR